MASCSLGFIVTSILFFPPLSLRPGNSSSSDDEGKKKTFCRLFIIYAFDLLDVFSSNEEGISDALMTLYASLIFRFH